MSETTSPYDTRTLDDPDRCREVAARLREWRAVCQQPATTRLEREVAYSRWLAAAHRQAMERRQAA